MKLDRVQATPTNDLPPEFIGNAYMTRLADRAIPVAPDAPFLLSQRPRPTRSELCLAAAAAAQKSVPFRRPILKTDEQQRLQREHYEACIARPATRSFTTFIEPII